MAGRSLLAQQRTLEVTGQNVANASTPGYSRQIALLRSVAPSNGATLGGVGSVGGGVDATQVVRAHAAWLDRAADGLRAETGGAGIAHQTLGQVEQALGEPGESGLQATLNRFFDAFQAVADKPGDATLRRTAVTAAEGVASRFAQALSDVESIRKITLDGANQNVAQVNALAKNIADLSHAIGNSQAAGLPASELLDQRDAQLEALTKLTGAAVSGRESGELVVSLNGATLVQGDRAETLKLDQGGTLSLENGTPVAISGGELGGRLTLAGSALPELAGKLQASRDNLVQKANAIHATGTDRTGQTGQPLFTVGAGGAPTVSAAIKANPDLLATGDGTAASGTTARALSALRDDPSILPSYQTLVGDLGSAVTESVRRQDAVGASLQQIQDMQASESGVNIDEELANMVAQQHVYAASARLLSTYDQMLETLITRTGV